ncbi:MAG: hypothetical protein FWF69_04960 [Firmicutes bacterium]|nr:hypothetical protein [Bacillota bacterium]
MFSLLQWNMKGCVPNSLDMAEVEALITQVMKKELRAIAWFGALLGVIMGVANTVAGAVF